MEHHGAWRQEVVRKDRLQDVGFGWVTFREALRKWVLSVSGDHFMIDYLTKSYL